MDGRCKEVDEAPQDHTATKGHSCLLDSLGRDGHLTGPTVAREQTQKDLSLGRQWRGDRGHGASRTASFHPGRIDLDTEQCGLRTRDPAPKLLTTSRDSAITMR